MLSHQQVRSLMRPALYKLEAERGGISFTSAEEDSILEAYLLADSITGHGFTAAIKKARHIAFWHKEAQAKARDLRRLKSVSKAYRASAVLGIRNGGPSTEKANDDRKGTQALARHTSQPSHPTNSGVQGGSSNNFTVPGASQSSFVVGIAFANNQFGGGGIGGNHPSGGLGPQGLHLAHQAYQQSFVQAPPKPKLATTIKHGEITAWRAWKVSPGGYLHSMSAGTMWSPGQPMSIAAGPQGLGGLDDGFGVHAWKIEAQAHDYIAGSLDAIVGEVELWGEVIEHQEGYRAEYAKIKSLNWATPNLNLRDLQRRYGVPELFYPVSPLHARSNGQHAAAVAVTTSMGNAAVRQPRAPQAPIFQNQDADSIGFAALVPAIISFGLLSLLYTKYGIVAPLLAIWVVAGILAAGFTFATLNRHVPELSYKYWKMEAILAAIMFIAGPLGLGISAAASDGYKRGWSLWPEHLRKKKS